MFDTYVVRPGDQHHSHHHEVHEHRAPTDESVKLLTEMERAMLKRLLFSVRVDDCQVDCVIHALKDNFGLDTKWLIQYKINGVQHRIDHVFVDRGEAPDRARERLVCELVDALSRDIARRMLMQPLTVALRGHIF
jgi:hypothetical protein